MIRAASSNCFLKASDFDDLLASVTANGQSGINYNDILESDKTLSTDCTCKLSDRC